MPVSETSIKAYAEIVTSGKAKTQADKIYALLQKSGSMTRDEIASVTGFRLASVCGRINELIKADKVEETIEVISEYSGHKVKLVRVKRPFLFVVEG